MEEAANALAWVHEIALARPKVKKEPLMVEDLRKIAQPCLSPGASLTDIRTAAMCLLSFTALLRYDELSSIRGSDIVLSGGHMQLRLRKSKNNQYQDCSRVIVARLGTSTDDRELPGEGERLFGQQGFCV